MELIHTKFAFTIQQTKNIAIQLLQAIEFVHKQGLVHRDIKPENILILNNPESLKMDPTQLIQVCVADFGLACHLNDSEFVYNLTGTPGYIAPEILREEGPYTPQADIFSIGSLLFNIINPTSINKQMYIKFWNHRFEPLPGQRLGKDNEVQYLS